MKPTDKEETLSLDAFCKDAFEREMEVDGVGPPPDYITEEDSHPWTDEYGSDVDLLDIYGRPICVGDVAMFHAPEKAPSNYPKNGAVGDIYCKNQDYYFRVRHPENGIDIYELFDISSNDDRTLEIIGNIYDAYSQSIDTIIW